jgi:hypothetical protein
MGRSRNAWTLLVLTALLLPGAGNAQALLAKARSEQSADVTLELTELKRTSGNTVTLKALITNKSAKPFYVSWSAMYLLNTAGRVKHGVVKDERGKWVASSGTSVRAGESAEIWAKFAAPPEDVKKMTAVVRGFAPFEDIPLGF